MEFHTEGLPEGWVKTKLITIADICGGKRLPKDHTYAENITNFPYIRVVDFENMGIKSHPIKYLKLETHLQIQKYTISKNDLYISIAGSIGKVGTIPNRLEDANLTENAAKITNISINKLFLCMVLNSSLCQQQIHLLKKATTQPKLALFRIETIILPIPPLPEQHRIVSKLESIFGRIDACIDRLEKLALQTKSASGSLSQLKSSVLKQAFEGRLAQPNLQNCVNTWSSVKLGDLTLFSKNGFTGRPNENNKGIPRLGIETVTGSDSIFINTLKCKFVNIPLNRLQNYLVRQNDLFFCRQNGNKNYVGKCGVFNKTSKQIIFSDSLIQFRINIDQISPNYIAYFSNSPHGRNQIEQYCSTTAGNYSINGTNLKKIIINFPPLPEQHRIVSKIESIFDKIDAKQKEIDRIEAQLKSIPDSFSELKSSILKLAFEGKLVPQDPDDEPAHVLLKRIHQEKTKSK